MTKAELVEEVARTTQLTKKQAEIIVNEVFDSIVHSLKSGEKIELRGFGSFRIRHRGARTGRNPKTGDKVKVPPKRIPYFKPGKELRELLELIENTHQTGNDTVITLDGQNSITLKNTTVWHLSFEHFLV